MGMMRHSAWCNAPRAFLFSSARISTRRQLIRTFHATCKAQAIKPFILADIGEGIREVQIIQWFVQPGARVEEFDKLCEVQSDKASVEITSRFTGVIKRLHYESDDMAIVGKPLVDIDIEGDLDGEDASPLESSPEDSPAHKKTEGEKAPTEENGRSTPQPGKHATLATPAVRHLTKELGVSISEIQGTGKEGRVTKEDVQKYAAARTEDTRTSHQSSTVPTSSPPEDRTVTLTPIQAGMFKSMTKSLSIPHFLYTDAIDTQNLNTLRNRLNARNPPENKISALAFILKAISVAFTRYPTLNAKLDLSDPEKPKLQLRGSHDFGIAVDSPQGLLVPVVKSIQHLSIPEIAAEISRLGLLAREGKLSAKELSGGTFTVSNVGSIGGGVVSPVIVEGQTGIVGIGKTKVVPAFDEDGNIVKKEECVFSWSADHRVVDGATAARCAEVVKGLLERPEELLVALR